MYIRSNPKIRWIEPTCNDLVSNLVSTETIGIGRKAHVNVERSVEGVSGCHNGLSDDLAPINPCIITVTKPSRARPIL